MSLRSIAEKLAQWLGRPPVRRGVVSPEFSAQRAPALPRAAGELVEREGLEAPSLTHRGVSPPRQRVRSSEYI